MSPIDKLIRPNSVQAALTDIQLYTDKTIASAITIQQIPAPTFSEEKRARYIETEYINLGLKQVKRDNLHNVYGCLIGQTDKPPLIVSAHTDTVFPQEMDLTIRHKSDRIYGPGLGDNSVGVAGLLTLAEILQNSFGALERDVWFVANVGEEGLGDLRGMRAAVERFGDKALYLVLEGGLLGQVYHQAIGVRRFQITVNTSGGHSWGNFGQMNAIHILSQIIAGIYQLPIPKTPKTTYNVGTITGGTSINTIAASAQMLLDLRSEDTKTLESLVQQVHTLVNEVCHPSEITVSIKQVGNRPSGSIPLQTPLVQWAIAALHAVGYEQVGLYAGSTDANIPLSRGCAAVCIGLVKSGNAHRFDEFIEPSTLGQGLKQLLLLTLAAAGLPVNSSR